MQKVGPPALVYCACRLRKLLALEIHGHAPELDGLYLADTLRELCSAVNAPSQLLSISEEPL